MPKSASAIVGAVAGLFVVMSAPAAIVTFLGTISNGILLIVFAIVGIVVFLEVMGVREHVLYEHDSKTGHRTGPSVWSYLGALVLVGLVVLMFMGTGGATFLGIAALPSINLTTLAFVVVFLAALYWITKEEKQQ